jgi:hypothetical protein
VDRACLARPERRRAAHRNARDPIVWTQEAFERLRSSARSRGRKVADLARDVVESSTSPLTVLPDELTTG